MTWRRAAALVLAGGAIVGAAWSWGRSGGGPWANSSSSSTLPVSSSGPPLVGGPRVFIIDDGTRIASDAGLVPELETASLWTPGQDVALFGLPGETVAFQVVVSAGSAELQGVTVDVTAPRRVGGEAEEDEAVLGVRRFVEAELVVPRRSGGREPGASLGWRAGAGPPGPAGGGSLTDPLIPVSWLDRRRRGAAAPPPPRPGGVAPDDHPLTVPAGRHRVVWVDVDLPAEAPAGRYRGEIAVVTDPGSADAARGVRFPSRVSFSVDVGATALPFRALKTMLFFEPDTIEREVGPEALPRLYRRLHRHHVSPIVPLRSVADVERHLAMLDGSMFSRAAGYTGPGPDVPADVVVIGAYGSLRAPSPRRLDTVDAMLARLEAAKLYGRKGGADVFLYAVDEVCDSPLGPAWRRALDESGRPRLQRLRVGHTCSEPPAAQPVDVVMVFAGAYDPARAAAGRDRGKSVWIYNGELPRTGSYLTDAWPLSLRANGWIQAFHRIPRWFYWEGAHWTDDNEGGQGPFDPWATAETFHNQHGDHANGDGVLLYPGRQTRRGHFDLGIVDVAPSWRLKQWRRGLLDGAYLQLARRIDPAAADRVAAPLVADTFRAADAGPPSVPVAGPSARWRRARRALFDIIRGGAETPAAPGRP
ncbi:MAG: hypothetical protein AAF715_06155 [Myxococcota bacterium]